MLRLEEARRWRQNGNLDWSSDVGQHIKMGPAVEDVAWKTRVF